MRLTNHRIAIVMPNLACGGAERVAVNLANNFIGRGYAVDMVLLSASGEFLADLRDEVRVVDLQANRIRGAVPLLAQYIRQSKPSALLACMWPLTVAALVARTIARVPLRVVVAEHTTWSRDEIASTLWGRFKVTVTMKCAFKVANGIVAVSQGAADDLARFAKIDRNAITAIYNPVVDGAQLPIHAELGPMSWWTGAHRRVLAVGALKPIKDYATLLDAFSLVRQRIDARLLILGEGICRPELEEQVKRLKLTDSVFMPGFSKDTSAYYQRTDLHVLSSTGEGFGNVIVEAMEAGAPVVSTDCLSGPREILCDGQFGRLVPVGNADALAKAIIASLLSAHDSVELKARAQDFSIDKSADRYLKLLLPEVLAPGCL